MGRPQFSAPRPAWSWAATIRNSIGTFVTGTALVITLYLNYELEVALLGVLGVAAAIVLQMAMDRKLMET